MALITAIRLELSAMFWRDLAYAWRQVRNRPLHFALISTTVGAGVCVAALVMFATYWILLRPLPYAAPQELLLITESNPALGIEQSPLSVDAYRELSLYGDLFAGLGAATSCVPFTHGEGERARELTCQMVTPSIFPMLGIKPHMGRLFRQEDAGVRAVMVSYAYWRQSMGGGAHVVGQTLMLSDSPYEVIGVLPAGFELLGSQTDIWAPMTVGAAAQGPLRRYLAVIARLPRNTTPARVAGVLDAMRTHQRPDATSVDGAWRLRMVGLHEALVRSVRPVLHVALASALVLLVVVCGNAYMLTAAARLSRRQELAVRLALGASPRSVARLLWAEVVLTTLLVAVVMAVFTIGASQLVFRVGPAFADVTRVEEIRVSTVWPALALMAGGLALAAAVVSLAILPWAGARSTQAGAPPSSALREAFLLGGQAAIAVTASCLAVTVVASALAIQRGNHGFLPSNLLTARMVLPLSIPRAQRVALVEQLLWRVRGLAGAEQAAVVRSLPLTAPFGARSWFSHDVGGAWDTAECERKDGRVSGRVSTLVKLVSTDYFATMRIPIRAGRDLTSVEFQQAAGVAVVSQQLVDRLALSVGEELTCEGGLMSGPVQVIGVAADAVDSLPASLPMPAVYVPYSREPLAAVAVAVRVRRDAGLTGETLRGAMQDVDARVPVVDIRTMEARIAAATVRQQAVGAVFAASAGAALLIAGAGAFGLARYTIGRRRRELMIRLALGGSRFAIWLVIVARVLVAGGAGALSGGFTALAAIAALRATLVGIVPPSIAIIAGGTCAVLVTLLLACLAVAKDAGAISASGIARHT